MDLDQLKALIERRVTSFDRKTLTNPKNDPLVLISLITPNIYIETVSFFLTDMGIVYNELRPQRALAQAVRLTAELIELIPTTLIQAVKKDGYGLVIPWDGQYLIIAVTGTTISDAEWVADCFKRFFK